MFALDLWLLVLIYADRDLVQLKNLADYGPVIALWFTGFYYSLKKESQNLFLLT